MRLMLYLLLHNPTILYSPNGTAADDIIKKVNARGQAVVFICLGSLEFSTFSFDNISSSFTATGNASVFLSSVSPVQLLLSAHNLLLQSHHVPISRLLKTFHVTSWVYYIP